MPRWRVCMRVFRLIESLAEVAARGGVGSWDAAAFRHASRLASLNRLVHGVAVARDLLPDDLALIGSRCIRDRVQAGVSHALLDSVPPQHFTQGLAKHPAGLSVHQGVSSSRAAHGMSRTGSG